MKFISCELLVLFSLFAGSVAARDEAINGLKVTITNVSPSGIINVTLTNAAQKPIKIFKESNSWGAAQWRVFRIRKGQLDTFIQNPYQKFTANVPSYQEIAVKGHFEKKLDLNAGNWCGLGQCSSWNEHGFGGKNTSFEPGDIVIVSYDVPEYYEPALLKLGAWYGVASAMTTIK